MGKTRRDRISKSLLMCNHARFAQITTAQFSTRRANVCNRSIVELLDCTAIKNLLADLGSENRNRHDHIIMASHVLQKIMGAALHASLQVKSMHDHGSRPMVSFK
jgi:hypothetical protein